MERESEYEDEEEEEEYIEMELSLRSSSNSSPQSREFEFSAAAIDQQQTTADHLFHKGKLLPLCLLPYTATSPSESDDFFFEWSSDLNTFVNQPLSAPTKTTSSSWHSILRASKAYLKSLFVKSAKPKPTIANVISSDAAEDNNPHRRSFSSAIKRHSPKKCLSSSSSNSSSGSSSFSLNSNAGLQELHSLRRSSSATEIQGSIEAAIAHCKKSHQIF